MALNLSPRIYNKNFTWGVLPRNKLDTVAMQPVINTPLDEPISYTYEITNVNVKGTDYNLPIDTTVKPTMPMFVNNYEKGQPTTICECFVGCVVATGSVSFSLDAPLPRLPVAKLHFEGTTSYVNRGSKSYADMEWHVNLNAATWIKDNASGEESWTDKSTDSINRGMYDDPTLIDYTATNIPMYGWVRKLRPASSGLNKEDRNQPDPQDILTTWVDQSKSSHWALRSNWTAYNKANAVEVWPDTLYAKGDMQSTKLVVLNRTIPIKASVVKIDDYNYRVDYSAPVRYEYMATSQYYTSIFGIRTYHDLDNYSFLDRITKITVELVTQKLNEETQDITLGLDGEENLTSEVTNEHPISFEQNELITSGTTWEDLPWTDAMSKYLLTKFKDGKYIVECEVPASWALRNNVHINTTMNIQLQDGTMITRNGVVSEFEVKTIEKRSRGDSFIYALRLMEV